LNKHRTTAVVIGKGGDTFATCCRPRGALGLGAVGTQNDAASHPLHPARRHVGFVAVARGVELPGEELFYSHVHLHGGPAPVRRFLPQLIELIWNRQIDPGGVFDLTMPSAFASLRT
jgi:hypothetical protein